MKKYLTLSILLIMSFLLISCELIKWGAFKQVYHEEILTQKEEQYYVLLYSETCPHCEDLLEVALQYKNSNPEIPLYVLNTSDKVHNEEIMAPDEYEYQSYIGTELYTDIRVAHVPALIMVENGKVNGLICSYTTDYPKTEIAELLKVE